MIKLGFMTVNWAGPFSGLVLSREVIVLTSLITIILAQSLGVIYAKQTKRLLHAQIQSLYAARDKLQVEWSQLLLEQGTWQADARVERIARDKLGMVVPDKINVIIP